MFVQVQCRPGRRELLAEVDLHGSSRKLRARPPAAHTLQEGKSADKKKTLIFVDNRLEGNALETIRAMIDGVEA